MIRFAIVLAAGVAAMASPAANAADVAQIGCVAQGLKPEVRSQLIADLEANLHNANGEQKYSPEVVAAVAAAGEACATQYRWSAEAKTASMLYSLPSLGWATTARVTKAAGLDIKALEKRFMALPEAERMDALNETVLGKVAEAAVNAGEIKESNATLGGAVFGLLAVREKALADFKSH